ncbi:MAG: hypothetical protein HOP14_00305 [Acidobacteria bacterium]|nr:hypothetical protein [Acidobacteriota bacterium]
MTAGQLPTTRPHPWRSRLGLAAWLGVVLLGWGALLTAQAVPELPVALTPETGWQADDRAIAARFAPVFLQGFVGAERFDYITAFDFDGDWVGDNNWQNAADIRYPLKATVYYAVSETATHYFIHYAVFHPRDYKGGALTGALLSQAVRSGAQASERLREVPLANDLVLAHENDLEGCLVVVRKGPAGLASAATVFVETLAHNRYLPYAPRPLVQSDVGFVALEDERPVLYIEPKGHGIEAYDPLRPLQGASPEAAPADDARAAAPARTGFFGRIAGLVTGVDRARRRVNGEGAEFLRRYHYTGEADDPDQVTGDIGYDLAPIVSTLWPRARAGVNETYGDVTDFGLRTLLVPGHGEGPIALPLAIGPIGASFRGVEGAVNMARPPWGWFDMTERDRPAGEWFLDPASVAARHAPELGADPPVYVHQPLFGVIRLAALHP